MSTHYLIDQHNSVLLSSEINAVLYSTTGQTAINGNFLVRVPDEVSVQNPTNLSDLLNKKYQGTLASYPGFLNIAYDDMLDSSGIDMALPTTKIMTGSKGTNCLLPNGGVLRSTLVSLTGPAPAEAILKWEIWEASYDNVKNERFVRFYNELPSSSSFVTAEVTFNNSVTSFTVDDGVLFHITGADVGTQFKVTFQNVDLSKKIYLASWALIYLSEHHIEYTENDCAK